MLTTRCPRLQLPDSLSELPLARRLRKQIPQFRRRVERMGIAFRWVPPEEMKPDAVDLLFELHDSRRSLKGDSSFKREVAANFHRRLIAASSPDGGPAMVVAEYQGRPIGVLYGFVWRDTFSWYQGGWDASYANLRLGTVLISEAIRLARLHGLRHFDFLRGIEPTNTA